MARYSGILDKVQVLDSSENEITTAIGHIVGCGFGVDNKTEVKGSINAGADFVEHIDKVVDITAELTLNPINMKFLQLIGTITGTSPWTWEWDDTLPEYKIKGNIVGSTMYATISNIKFGEVSIRFAEDNPLEVTLRGYAKNLMKATGSLTASTPTTARINFLDGYLDDGAGNEFAKIKTFTLDLRRDLEPRGGIEKRVSDAKRLPSDIIEKMKTITFSGTAEITDDSIFDKVMGGNTIADSRSDITLKLNFSSSQGYITLTGARINKFNHTKSADGEIRTVDFDGSALGITAGGS